MKSSIGSRVTLSVFIFLAAATTAAGRVIRVDGRATGTGDGSTWGNACVYLQDALKAAQPGDTILVATGRYTPDRYTPDQGAEYIPGDRAATFQLKSGVIIQGGYAGLSQADPDARDVELYRTTLTGDLGNDDVEGSDVSNLTQETSRKDNSYHVVTARNVDANTVLDGLIITGGNASESATVVANSDRGGGLYCDAADLVLMHCTFRANSASREGGGMYTGAYSDPTLVDCNFVDNAAKYGGAMSNASYSNLTIKDDCWFSRNHAEASGGAMYSAAKAGLTLADCNFIDNSAKYGGAVLNNSERNLTIMDGCRFERNRAERGGGIYNEESSPTVKACSFISNREVVSGGGMYNGGSSPVVTGCTFLDNSATNGGGMRNENGSNPKVDGCRFQGNDANDSGGGMYNAQSSPTVADCNFFDNEAQWGAGMCNETGSCPKIQSKCLFVGNRASASGGGVYNEENSPAVEDCNFVDNEAKWGGGMYNNRSWPGVRDCNFTDNHATHGGGIYSKTKSKPTVTNCRFIGNSATYGAGMRNVESSHAVVDHCWFNGNDAKENGGGMNNDGSSPAVRDCNFVDNDARWGGGMYSATKSIPTVTNCHFTGNSATYGAGMWNYDGSNAVVDRCWFEGNDANEYGGGMYNSASSPVVSNCIFTGNKADWGGAMRNGSQSSVRIFGCLFRANAALDGGGGLSHEACSSTLTNCTFLYNSAHTGGALHCYGSLASTRLRNCILWSDVAVYGPEFAVVDPATLSFSYCDVQGGLDAAYNTTSSALIWGDDNIDEDPRLTPDGHLMAGSPCIEAGDSGAASSFVDGNDIDGEPRLFGRSMDIGCDEFVDTDLDGLPDMWEQMYFGDTTSAVREADPDGDGLTNIEEYSLYSSNPVAAPYYVAADYAGDSWSDGTVDHPYGTIREGLAAAGEGDTVLVAPGTYAGPGNTDLDFRGKGVVLRAGAGPSATTITGDGERSVFRFRSGETPASALIGFTIRDGWADYGGGIDCRQSHPQIRNCVLHSNRAKYRGDAIYCRLSVPRIADCLITGSAYEGIYIQYGAAQLEGKLQLAADSLETQGAILWGAGTLEMDRGSVLRAGWDMRIRCHLAGNGTFEIKTNAECTMEGAAVIDLGGDGQEKGQIVCDGLLRMKDRTELRNVNLRVKRARFEDHVIVSNSVITAEAGAPFGQFFIQDTVLVKGNDIHADGDRYMDLDPAAFRGVIANNRIYVTITEGQNHTLGGLLELRGLDLYGPAFPPEQFLCPLGAVPDFSTATWTIEQLELAPGAKVNLTNRFDFGNGGLSEVMYAKKLVLGEGSVLNTAFHRLYYGQLDQADTATIMSVPILGLSLNNIAFDDADEFASRIVSNNFTHNSKPIYSRVHIERVVGRELDPNGMMSMRNLKDLDPDSPTSDQVIHARAKGLFAKSGEQEVLVRFEYLFCSAAGELVIYLSDVSELLSHEDPARAEHYIEVGRITAPPAGWPGSAGSGRFAVFEKIVPVRHLNFLLGTRMELELIGPPDAAVLINNWDPGVRCIATKCGDVAGERHGVVDATDFLAVLSECGRRTVIPGDTSPTGTPLFCLDCIFSLDGVVTIEDALTVEWAADGADFPCEVNAPDVAPTADLSRNLRLSQMSASAQVAGPLLVAGKGRREPGGSVLGDWLYGFTADGIQTGDPCLVATGKVLGKVVWHEGLVYHLDVELGLLQQNRSIIPPGPCLYGSDTVYVGRYREFASDSANYFWSVPLQDVAFDKDGYAYVVPVLVDPEGRGAEESYYYAAAKLQLKRDGNSPYTVVQLYDIATQNGYGLHEIEVDASGWVYVLKSCPSNTMDLLHVFRGATGVKKENTPVHLDGMVAAPTCLLVSDKTEKLYLASALNAPNATETRLYVMDKNTLRIAETSIAIPGMGHMTGITEDPLTGTLWVAGFTIPSLPTAAQIQDEDGDSSVLRWGESFYRPRLAKIEQDGSTLAVTVFDLALDWMLPVSVVWTGSDGL